MTEQKSDRLPCPHCGDMRTYKNGWSRQKQKWYCPRCNKSFQLRSPLLEQTQN